jgi:hypothetical protein
MQFEACSWPLNSILYRLRFNFTLRPQLKHRNKFMFASRLCLSFSSIVFSWDFPSKIFVWIYQLPFMFCVLFNLSWFNNTNKGTRGTEYLNTRVQEKDNIKNVLENVMWKRKLGQNLFGQGWTSDVCKNGNEPSDSEKVRILSWLMRDCKLLKEVTCRPPARRLCRRSCR